MPAQVMLKTPLVREASLGLSGKEIRLHFLDTWPPWDPVKISLTFVQQLLHIVIRSRLCAAKHTFHINFTYDTLRHRTFNFIFIFILRICDRQSTNRVQTHTVCAMQIDKNRHNRTINCEDGGRTTGLQTLSSHYCSLTRTTLHQG